MGHLGSRNPQALKWRASIAFDRAHEHFGALNQALCSRIARFAQTLQSTTECRRTRPNLIAAVLAVIK